MSRQPDSVDCIMLDVAERNTERAANDYEPAVGDIYKSRAGQPAYWWVVAITRGEFHHTAIYIVFNMRGEIIGASNASVHYLREREKVGKALIPSIQPQWFF